MRMPKIDTHHHILPPLFIELWNKNAALSGAKELPSWSPDQSLEFMKRNNIRAAILALGAPATSIEYPSQFGFLATLPSLSEDIDACLDEIQYSLSVLEADGVNLLTSYGGKYLGHPDFQPVWNELDKRSAVVFIHPNLEGIDSSIQEPRILPSPVFDWTHETTRTAAHLIMTGMVQTHRECKIILSHGGGSLPYIVNRIANLGADFQLMEASPEEFLDEARRFYFDLALAGYNEPMQLLLEFARPGHILYGSDYPWGQEKIVANQLQTINKVLLEREDARLITQDAALELIPRLKNK